MKRIVIVVLVLTVSVGAKAQTFKEWFEQKKTQIEYLVNQIAALKVYANTIEKGYRIAHEGLTVIGNIKKGDFSLHSNYFSSLKLVNPQIKTYWKVADIIQTEVSIIKSYNRQNKLLHSSRSFTSDEVKYCSAVFSNLLDGCNDIIDELIAMTTDHRLQMKDDERMERIDELHAAIKDRQKFILSFESEISLLAVQRARDQNDVVLLRSLLGIE